MNTVNEDLTPKSPKSYVENDAFAQFAQRVIRAHGRRVAQGDVDALAGMLEASRAMDEAIAQAVRTLREEHGYSWAEIGARLGVSKQACHQRWGR